LPSTITLLFALWYTEIALRCLATYRVYHTRLLREYPILFVFLLTSVVKSTLLVQARQAPRLYAMVYSIGVPLTLILEYLCGIEIFDHLTSHMSRFSRIGRRVLLVFALVGVFTSMSTRGIGVPNMWGGMWEAAVLLNRYALLSLFVGLVLMAVYAPKVRSGPMPRVALRALIVMSFYVCGNAIFDTIMVWTGGTKSLSSSIGGITIGLIATFGWLTLPAGESSPNTSLRETIRDFVHRVRTWWPNLTPRTSEHR
jgi:hypothetical protein